VEESQVGLREEHFASRARNEDAYLLWRFRGFGPDGENSDFAVVKQTEKNARIFDGFVFNPQLE